MSKIAIIYYSSTGSTYEVACAVEEGARAAGADTRLRKVRELAPEEAIASNPQWQLHHAETAHILEASHEDLAWADGYVFGSPTRFGNIASQLKQFLDTTGPLWAQGKLSNKVAAAFTSAMNAYGGQETTLLALYNIMYHWGAVIVPPGYTHAVLYTAGGNPDGVSFTAREPGQAVPVAILMAGRYLGARVARFADVLAENRGRLVALPVDVLAGAVRSTPWVDGGAGHKHKGRDINTRERSTSCPAKS